LKSQRRVISQQVAPGTDEAGELFEARAASHRF
jgi:hypothetical protein